VINMGTEKKVKTVLWIYKHEILPAQALLLSEKLGDFKIVMFRDKVPSAEWLLKNVILPREVDIIVIPVLPLSIIARLFDLSKRYGFEIWWAQMELIHIDYSENCPEFDHKRDIMVPGVNLGGKRIWRHYRFKGFYRVKGIKGIKMELERV